MEIQCDYINETDSVLLVDDLLATGGTLEAAITLIKKVGATVPYSLAIFELPNCNGRARLPKDTRVETLMTF